MADQFTLKGIVDETFDFAGIRLSKSNEIHIFCKEIIRITSTGLKEWLNIFKNLRTAGKSIKFFEVSPVLIRQTVYVKGIVQNKEVVSLCAEFVCGSCHAKELKVFTPSALEKMSYEMNQIECPKCRKQMDFDDLSDEYFSFLREK